MKRILLILTILTATDAAIFGQANLAARIINNIGAQKGTRGDSLRNIMLESLRSQSVVRDTNAIPASGSAWRNGNFYRLTGTKNVYYYDRDGSRIDLEMDGSETKINAGTNVTVSGTGTIGNPYVISATGGGGGGAGVDTISNYAALRNYNGTANMVWVTNNRTQGLFVISLPTLTDDSAIVIANGLRRWQRIIRTNIFPEWKEGVDTTNSIQWAIDFAAQNVGGSRVVELREQFSPYNISRKFLYRTGDNIWGCLRMRSNVTLRLSESTILRKGNGVQVNGTPVCMIVGQAISNATIEGGIIDGNRAGQPGWTQGSGQGFQAGSGIHYLASGLTHAGNRSARVVHNTVIRNCIIRSHFGTPVEVQLFKNGLIENVTYFDVGEGVQYSLGEVFRGNNLRAWDSSGTFVGDGFELAVVQDFHFSNFTCTSPRGMGAGTAIDISSSRDGTVNQFYIEGWSGGVSYGSTVQPGDTIACTNITTSDGVIRRVVSWAMFGGDGDVTYNNILVDSCDFGASINGGGFGYYTHKDRSFTKISNCFFRGRGTGAAVQVGPNNVNAIIEGNTFLNWDTGNNVVGLAGQTRQHSYTATGNTFSNTIKAIEISAQSQANFRPIINITGNTFQNMSASGWGINGVLPYMNVRNNTFDEPRKVANGGNFDARGCENVHIVPGAAGTINTISGVGKGATVTVFSDLPNGSAITFSDYRNGSGNLVMITDFFTMPQRAALTFYMDSTTSRLYEIGRSRTEGFSAGAAPETGFIDHVNGWAANNIAANTTLTLSNAGISDYMFPSNGSLRRVYIRTIGGAVSTGTLTVNIRLGGTVWATAQITAGQSEAFTNYSFKNKGFSAGTTVQVEIVSSSNYAPTNLSCQVVLTNQY